MSAIITSYQRGQEFEREIYDLLREVGIMCHSVCEYIHKYYVSEVTLPMLYARACGDGGVDIDGEIIEIPIVGQCKNWTQRVGVDGNS
ncbi:8904_t:CDS:2 [Ambispora gerdemannii]|uniref:8904_t:CDS:1 n=1 Tax=Ambispora gerdemannii TaxID=144530 RepID=A0A9N8WFG1_9GLOM|nr:8904_t:CDS:2 [Ambispora gerdemannii]